MSTYTETEADLPRIREQIRYLARTRDHHVARQLTQLDTLTLKAAQSMRSYLARSPVNREAAAAVREFEARRWAAQDRDIAAQVSQATAAATAAVHDAPSSLNVGNEDDQTPVTRTSYAGDSGNPPGHRGTQRAPAAERISGEGDEGYYFHDGRMYKVITSKYGAGQGHLYAKRLNEQTGDWERAQGMTGYLHKSERVTLEQAVEFGRQLEITPQMALYGKCWICKRVLTDEESIRNRVGPGPHIGIDA